MATMITRHTNTTVFCSLQIEGTHNWPDCPIEEVGYLRDPHRHMFHIKAYKEVTHSDRDVEFIWLKHQIHEYLIQKFAEGPQHGCFGFNVCAFGAMSCEMIAELVITQFNLSKCEVSEDGENGAVVTVTFRTEMG